MKQTTVPIKSPTKLSFLASYLIIAILVLLPFHTLLTTWAGSNFGHLDAFRIWKEILLVPLGIYMVFLVVTKPKLWRQWSGSWLVWTVLIYGLFFIGYAARVLIGHQVVTSAVIYSLFSNLRFLVFLLVVWAVTTVNNLVRRRWTAIVLAPAFVVVAFGILQRTILPADALQHVGYGPKTIPAIETVDNKLAYRRIQSSLRGANPLGAYLIVPFMTAGALVRKKPYLWIFLGACLATLFFTYSRSAELGLIAAVLFFGWHNLRDRRLRHVMVAVAMVAVLLLVGGIWTFRHNNIIQNTVFHVDETSKTTVTSNSQRSQAIRSGLHDVVHEPLGRGPGTAGPSSTRNNGQARLAENYYLQIGQEVGVIGLGLFLLINLLVVKALWARTDLLSRVLLASFAGITVVNCVSHAWADDTLGLLWWGLAGAAMSTPAILKRNHYEQKTNTKKI